jgi:hypothetical protein
MALISTQPIADQFGNIYENAYGVIDQCNGNKKETTQHFVFEVYRSQADRNNCVQPFMQDTIIVSGDDFDTWFSASAITADSNQYAQAYAYLAQMTVTTIDAENNPTTTLKYPNWQGD